MSRVKPILDCVFDPIEALNRLAQNTYQVLIIPSFFKEYNISEADFLRSLRALHNSILVLVFDYSSQNYAETQRRTYEINRMHHHIIIRRVADPSNPFELLTGNVNLNQILYDSLANYHIKVETPF